LSNLVVSSVSEMNTFQRPGTIPRNNRADWVETTVFQVYATLTVYKRETDEDYHLVLQDPDDGSTMIVEIRRPACVSAILSIYCPRLLQYLASDKGRTHETGSSID
jgi:hypothetical protein